MTLFDIWPLLKRLQTMRGVGEEISCSLCPVLCCFLSLCLFVSVWMGVLILPEACAGSSASVPLPGLFLVWSLHLSYSMWTWRYPAPIAEAFPDICPWACSSCLVLLFVLLNNIYCVLPYIKCRSYGLFLALLRTVSSLSRVSVVHTIHFCSSLNILFNRLKCKVFYMMFYSWYNSYICSVVFCLEK